MLLIISLQRKKCIGCGYCAAFFPNFFSMSKKDGKSILLQSKKRNKFYVLKSLVEYTDFLLTKKVEGICPINIINIKVN